MYRQMFLKIRNLQIQLKHDFLIVHVPMSWKPALYSMTV